MKFPTLSPRIKAQITHDGTIFLSIFLPLLADNHAGLGGLLAVAVTAVKLTLRKVAPVPEVTS
jgi:hypothetical protein